MFRKLNLFRRAQPVAEVAVPETEIVPVAAPQEAPQEPALHPVHLMPLPGTTALGKIFPVKETLLYQHKQKSALHVPDRLKGYAGLAAAVQALSAESNDRAAQLKALKSIARQLEQGSFSDFNKHASEADQDALHALNRLLTMNQGSGTAQKLHRVEIFMKAAKADHEVAQAAAVAKAYDSLDERIDAAAATFNQGIERYLTIHHGPTTTDREPLPSDSSVELAGAYPKIATIVASDKPDSAKWQSLRAIHKRLAAHEQDAYQRGALIKTSHLDAALYTVLREAGNASFTTAQRVALVTKAVELYHPAAQYAHDRAARDAKYEAARKTREAEGPVAPDNSQIDRMNAEYERHMEFLRNNPSPVKFNDFSSEPRLEDYLGKGMLGLAGALSLATVGVGIANPDAVRVNVLGMAPTASSEANNDPYAYETTEQMNARIQNEMVAKRMAFEAEMDAQEARRTSERRASLPPMPPIKPWRDQYRTTAIRIPPYDPYAGMSADERRYQKCLDNSFDKQTFLPLPGIDCGDSPEIKRIQEEAAKYNPPHSVGEIPAAPPVPAPIVDPNATPGELLTPPPISEAPRFTESDVLRMRKEFPQLVVAGNRSVEPMQPANATITFDTKR